MPQRSKTTRPKTARPKTVRLTERSRFRSRVIGGVLAGVGVLALSALPGAAISDQDDDVWEAVDSGSLGLAPEAEQDIWCLIDAGSLGIPDPLATC